MKKSLFIFILLFTVIVSFLLPDVSPSASEISVYADGETIVGFIEENISYAPLRMLAAACLKDEANVAWNPLLRTAVITFGNSEVIITADKDTAMFDEKDISLGGKAVIRSSTMYVPIRAVSEIFGYEVTWDGNLRSVTLECKPGGRQDDLYWLSRIISAESRGEPFEGQIAVGNVVLERVKSDEFPDSIYGVVFDTVPTIQFTPVENGTVYDEPEESCIEAAKLCLEGYTTVEGCLFFQNPETTRSSWVSENREFAVRIGNHCFYK